MKNNLYPDILKIAWDVTESEYRKDLAISYSTISRFSKEGFSQIKNLFASISTPSLVFGSMVDTLLTGTQEEFEDIFLVASFPKISDSLTSIVKDIHTNYGFTHPTFDTIPDEALSVIGKKHDFWADDKHDDKRAAKIRKPECAKYYKLLQKSKNKIVVSKEECKEACACADTILNTEVISNYFVTTPLEDHIEIHHQLKFKGEFESIPIRCMFDGIKIDHKNKTIQPFDLKTSSNPEWEFVSSYIKYKYYIQSNMYTYILMQKLKEIPEFLEYKVLPFSFIVISRFTKQPIVWEDTDSLLSLEKGTLFQKLPNATNWQESLKILFYYLNNPDRKIPIGIEHINTIQEWIK